MLSAANRTVVRLWKDESGVVLAVTMIVFLTLFVMACAVYAVGETVRLRVEIQNAADSAAYSAAVVQADCNSRVAAINRAMSWTYVQMVRMEMDYIVDKWLKLVLDKWGDDDDSMSSFNRAGSCQNWGLPFYSVGRNRAHTMILLNKHRLVSKYQIEAAREAAAADGKSYTALVEPIDWCRRNIEAMNQKEVELIRQLPTHVEKTVEAILKENIADTWNDQFAGGGRIMYSLFQEKEPLNRNFRILRPDEESDFLRHADYNDGVQATFKTGIDVWFVMKDGEGFQRDYRQRSNVLIAEWDWESTMYQQVEEACVEVAKRSGSSEVKAEEGRDENYTTARAKPQVLREVFFAKGGCLLVGLTRRLNNPFQFMVEGGALGIIRPFTVDGGNRFMWTAAAAIAGYNPKPRQDCQGKYEVTYEDNIGDNLWNLKTSDWDAELLPLHRAWAQGKQGRSMVGETAGQILNAVKGGPWIPLYGQGGALGEQGGPELMNKGAEVAYGGAEAWVLH